MALISLNYLDALNQVKKLENAAEQCEDAERAVDKVYQEVCENWSGEAAEAFKAKLTEWKTENNKIKGDIEETARLIKKVAQQIKAADEAASRAIQG